jgi:para-aminobenzoate synthetase/4-amino-4-deoxychorismate lyase
VTRRVAPSARFDNARDRSSQVLSGFEGELRAERLDEVTDVIKGAEDAARRGLWVAGYLAYESAPAFDGGLNVRARDQKRSDHLPLAWFGLYRECATSSMPRASEHLADETTTWSSEINEASYVAKVRSILRDIDEGTVYQVNLTNVLESADAMDARALYQRLLAAQEPAYGALIEHDGLAVVSASPELFFEWDGSKLRSRPMKGTIRRGRWPGEDHELARELQASPKETSENVMIVDLIRNDMGKVASVGSVRVTELLSLESYPNVWQLVSEVECTTKPGTQLLDVFGALFPCGSVTGAPKQSAMDIISSLEQRERGVYCGAVGLIAPSLSGPQARFNVAIRTAVVDQRARRARFGSGGGIVAASEPEREYREMRLKAEMLSAASSRSFGLLETFRFTPGVVNTNITRHLDRLERSAAFFGLVVRTDLASWVASQLDVVEKEARVRLVLSSDGATTLQTSPAPERRSDPVRLKIDDERVASDDVMLLHKTTERDTYARRQRRHAEVDDVIMVNERGECTEVTTANLALRKGPTWYTPSLASGCLPGIERARLIEEGVLLEATLTLEDLRGADELAVVNSLRGWRDAELVDGPAPPATLVHGALSTTRQLTSP